MNNLQTKKKLLYENETKGIMVCGVFQIHLFSSLFEIGELDIQ